MMSQRPDGRPVVIAPKERLWRLHTRFRHRLPMWVIYRQGMTREYPTVWVTRMHLSLPEPRPTRIVMTHDTLDQLRTLLPPGLSRLPRDPNDAPEIEEVWL